MAVAQSAKTESFDFLGFLEGIAPNALPEQQARAADEILLSQASAAAADVNLRGRPGIPLPLGQYRDMVMGTPSAGGNLGVSGVAAVAAAVRPALVIEQAGALRLNVSTAEVQLPIWTGTNDFASAWLPENGPAASFDQLQTKSLLLTPKAAAARIAYSRRLKKQTGGSIEAALLAEVGKAVAQTIEFGFLRGTGFGWQPQGILENTGLSTVSNFAASIPTRTELAGMVKKAASTNTNLGNCSFLLNSEDIADMLDTVVVANDSDALIEYEGDAHRILGFKVFATTNMPKGTVLFGDFTTCRVAYFGDPQVIVDGFSNGKSINGQSELILINYVDLGLMEPTHIVKGMA